VIASGKTPTPGTIIDIKSAGPMKEIDSMTMSSPVREEALVVPH
jgi:hypothetical protein